MSFPTSPPISEHTPTWSMPNVQERQLDWGLRLIVARVGHLPMIHTRFLSRYGRAMENPACLGSARLLSALIRHGTEKYTSVEMAENLDHLGMKLRVHVGMDSSAASVTALSEHSDAAFDMLEQVLLYPTFPESYLERERTKALEIHRHECSSPGFLSGVWMGQALYPGHPYGWPGATENGLKQVGQTDISDLHNAVFRLSQGLLLVVGDIEPARVLDELSERFAHPTRHPEGPPVVPMAPPADAPQVTAICRPGSEQVRVQLGTRLFPRFHPDYLPMALLNRVLGAGAASRLFMDLRERQSLTYGAYSALDLGRYGGDLMASLDCSPDKADRALKALWQHIHDICEPIPAVELEVARRSAIGAFPQRASGLGGVAGLLSQRWSYDLPDEVWETHLSELAGISTADVDHVAQKWLRPADFHTVLVGPREALEECFSEGTAVRWHQADDGAWLSGMD